MIQRLLRASLCIALAGCGGGSPSAPPEAPIDNSIDHNVAVTLKSLAVTPEQVEVHAGLTVQLKAIGTFSDKTEKDLTGEVSWSSSDPAIAVISSDTKGLLRGLAEGTVTIKASKDGVEVQREGKVQPAELRAIIIEGANHGETLPRGATRTLVIKGAFSDDVERALDLASLTFASSDASIAKIENGVITTLATGGPITLTITGAGGVQASIDISVACAYPNESQRTITRGNTMPHAKWPAAFNPDGSTFELDLEDVYCGDQFPEAKVIFFVIGTGWCPNCPAYIRAVNGMANDIQAAGGLLVFVEMQDENYDPTDSVHAQAYIRRLLGATGKGIRVGDTDIAAPLNLPFNRSPEIRAVPFVIAVRKSDMKYITDDAQFQTAFPFVSIATNPDMYDTTAPAVMCAAGTEETFEPNDTSDQAAQIGAGSFSGGICAAEPDYFSVNIVGAWNAKLEFNNAVGDLDIYVWDTFANAPYKEIGVIVGSNGSTGVETFDYHGPSIIRVDGYQGAQAPYTLTITPR